MNAKNASATIRKHGAIVPACGRNASPRLNASIVIFTPSSLREGSHAPERTIVRPVMVQITVVSMKVPVIDTSPWRAGSCVFAAAAAIGSDPRPASFEKMPRATPFCRAMNSVPTTPPVTAAGLNAALTIRLMAPGIFSKLATITSRQTSV